jgi:hypothetical protein
LKYIVVHPSLASAMNTDMNASKKVLNVESGNYPSSDKSTRLVFGLNLALNENNSSPSNV